MIAGLEMGGNRIGIFPYQKTRPDKSECVLETIGKPDARKKDSPARGYSNQAIQ
jgi:hypothetical protein